MFRKNFVIFMLVFLSFTSVFLIITSDKAYAGSYNGQDLALAILENQSTLIGSSYTDTDQSGHRQATILSSLGTMTPTHGSTFALFSTGAAGYNPSTTNEANPGDERGTWFQGGKYGHPRDESELIMTLQVPPYMHYLYYDIQFFSTEYPEYVGTQYNDDVVITVNSPSQGISTYSIDINSGYFVWDSHGIPGTGFDVFAQSGWPGGVDWLDTTPRTPGADAGATDLIPIGGESHPVSPFEEITVTINIKDCGDNLFDSAAFIDNLRFSGYAETEIIARKSAEDQNGGELECGDTLRYTIRISNTGSAGQDDNTGNEFEDFIPKNTTYVPSSATANYGTIAYNTGENKITWNGEIPAASTRILTFDVTINSSVANGTAISNQGTVYWDSNEDGTNDAAELTDDSDIDDGIDQDGDGQTDDDDPTNKTVFSFEAPPTITEGFDDDTDGTIATQIYNGRQWFETTNGITGSIFEVVPSYHYQTSKSFKTKIRSTGSPQFWNYTLSNLESDIKYWEIWFRCGNTSEDSDLLLTFKNSNGQDIAKIKFEYTQQGTEQPTDWILEINYWKLGGGGWIKLNSDFSGGYLYNDWYKLRIERNNDPSYIDYYLYRSNVGLVDFKTDTNIGQIFSDLTSLEWSNSKNPILCPMFFWDEHTLGITQ